MGQIRQLPPLSGVIQVQNKADHVLPLNAPNNAKEAEKVFQKQKFLQQMQYPYLLQFGLLG
jgi:hypothetical protein